MKRWLLAALFSFAAFATAAPAFAQQQRTFGWLGYCQITSLGSATKLLTANCSTGSVPFSPNTAEICVSVAAVRYTSDGTTPTASIGIPVAAGVCFQYAGPIGTIRFIQQTAGAVLDVEFFQ